MEPERRIEKWLRAFAKKRREQAGDPMELHPVARQQLQKEIARRAAGTRGGTWFSRFFLRPRFAFAISFAALVVVGLILLPNLNRPKPSTLASVTFSRNEMVPAEKTAPALQPPPVSTSARLDDAEGTRNFQDKQPAVSDSLAMNPVRPEPASANRQQAVVPPETPKQVDAFKNTIAQTEVSTGVTVVSAAPPSKELSDFKAGEAPVANGFGGASALSKDAAGPSLASAPAPTVLPGMITNGTTLAVNEEARKKLNLKTQSAPQVTTSTAFFDRSKSESAAVIPPVSQVFNRLDMSTTRRRADEKIAAPAPVLVSFRVEQTGNAMRVVDADGSVYIGAVELAQPVGAARALAPKNLPSTAPAARASAPSPAAQNYFFRVAGTNRNLKENVVFSGNLIPLTNAQLRLYGAGSVGGASGAKRAEDLPAELLLSNSRISGTATIGDQKEIEVIATPAP